VQSLVTGISSLKIFFSVTYNKVIDMFVAMFDAATENPQGRYFNKSGPLNSGIILTKLPHILIILTL
jgi:hypothetical protein